MKRRSTPVILALGLAFGACGGDDTGGQSDPDASVPDATVPDPDADPASFCEIVEFTYADLGMLAGTATLIPRDDNDPTGPQQLKLQMPINNDATPDTMFLELYENEEPFLGGIATGTFTISGKQTDLILCTVCAYLAGDYVDDLTINFHMASSGTLDITTVDTTPGTGSIEGSLTNLALREVTVNTMGQQPVVNACRTTIASLSFNLPIVAESP